MSAAKAKWGLVAIASLAVAVVAIVTLSISDDGSYDEQGGRLVQITVGRPGSAQTEKSPDSLYQAQQTSGDISKNEAYDAIRSEDDPSAAEIHVNRLDILMSNNGVALVSLPLTTGDTSYFIFSKECNCVRARVPAGYHKHVINSYTIAFIGRTDIQIYRSGRTELQPIEDSIIGYPKSRPEETYDSGLSKTGVLSSVKKSNDREITVSIYQWARSDAEGNQLPVEPTNRHSPLREVTFLLPS